MDKRVDLPNKGFRFRDVCDLQVIPNLYSAHMDPANWSKPKDFKPERFIDVQGQVTGRDRVISFALGEETVRAFLLGPTRGKSHTHVH
jgi:Cytochrome P450